MRSPHICPDCKDPVSAFAAGCSLCGAELDPRRAQGPTTIGERMRSAWRARPRPRLGIPFGERRR